MLLTTLALTAAITGSISPVESGLTCPNQEAGIQRFIEGRLTRMRYKSTRWRRFFTKRLAKRIVFEAKRFKLDPLVMTTIAWIESDFRPSVRGRYGGTTGVGRRMNEAGVFQLIPFDSMVRAAAMTVAGCKPLRVMPWQRKIWWRKYRGGQCLYADIGAARSRIGHFTRVELKSIVVGTFVAAFEMRGHIDACKKRRPKGHRWYSPRWLPKWRKVNPNVDVTKLERYLHYNWGSKQLPKHFYRTKLFKRYPRVRSGVCGKRRQTKRVASIMTR